MGSKFGDSKEGASRTNSVIIDTILEEKVRKTKERISENMHILANEPSLAYYRLQENIRKSLPPMIDKRIEAEKLQRDLQGNIYDLEYAIGELNNMVGTENTFKNILELSKTALFYKQQIKYLQTKKLIRSNHSLPSDFLEAPRVLGKKKSMSVYKRFSAHITMDLPDIPDALKDTATKMESIMGTSSRHSTMY